MFVTKMQLLQRLQHVHQREVPGGVQLEIGEQFLLDLEILNDSLENEICMGDCGRRIEREDQPGQLGVDKGILCL